MVAARPWAATAGRGVSPGVCLPAPRALPTGRQLRDLGTPAPPRPPSLGRWNASLPAVAPPRGRVGLPWQPRAGRGAGNSSAGVWCWEPWLSAATRAKPEPASPPLCLWLKQSLCTTVGPSLSRQLKLRSRLCFRVRPRTILVRLPQGPEVRL